MRHPQRKPEATRQVTGLKVVIACVLIVICSLLTTGFLGTEHAVDSNILQSTSAPGDVGSEADGVTLLTPDSAANLDNGSSSQIVNNPNYPQGVIVQNRQQSITLPDETSNSQTTVPTEMDNGTAHISIGVNYQSLRNMYSSKYTTDDILHRDFSRFHSDGINVISLGLFWYRLEGNTRGSYNGTLPDGSYYGDRFLDDVKRVIRTANEYGIRTLIAFNTLWGDDSIWCTPDYVVDPVTGNNIGLAIVRSAQMRQAFVEMFNRTVKCLAGIPGVWAWAVLNEPWYYPSVLPPPHNNINQKENFITLIEELSSIVRKYDDQLVTVKFINSKLWIDKNGAPHLYNLFERDWGWDNRIFSVLDFVSFNAYIHPELLQQWINVTKANIEKTCQLKGRPLITEFGYDTDNDTIQTEYVAESLNTFKQLPISGYLIWMWKGDDPWLEGKGYNLCSNITTGECREAYDLLKAIL